jgi:hypothetical protein
VYAAAVLTGNEYALEVQMSAYTLLQILVGAAISSCCLQPYAAALAAFLCILAAAAHMHCIDPLPL